MSIFYNKHFKGNYTFIFHFLIHTAIYIRAGLSVLKRFLKDTIFTLMDMLIIYGGIFLLKTTWENFSINLIGEKKILPNEFMGITVPICIAIWIFSPVSSPDFSSIWIN